LTGNIQLMRSYAGSRVDALRTFTQGLKTTGEVTEHKHLCTDSL